LSESKKGVCCKSFICLLIFLFLVLTLLSYFGLHKDVFRQLQRSHIFYSGPIDLTDQQFFNLLKEPYRTYSKAQLRDYYFSRMSPSYFPLSNWASQATIDRANNAMNNEIITYAGSNYDFSDGSGGFDWDLIPAGDLGLDAAAYLHRFYHMNNIANTYAHTKVWTPPPNEAYVNEIVFELDEYWNEFFKVTPIYHYPNGPELNALLNHFERIRNWIETFEYVGPIHESPSFDETDMVEYLKKLYMSIEYIRSNEVQWPITSNQIITGKATFVYAGIMYPEFEAADQWLQFGQDGLENIILTDIFEDGCHNERTPGYHHVTIGSLMNPYKLAAQNGISFSAAYNQRAKLSLDFLKYLVHPNYNYVPAIGDTSIQEGFSMWFPDGYNLFNDDTFRYVESYGTQGTRPTETSKAFNRCGYYILRSGWGQQGNQQSYKEQRHLTFDAARYAGSHSDRDNLQIILFAYDKLLLADPGEYILGGLDKSWFESTAAHNTIVVDNRDYNLRNNIPPAGPNPDFEDEVQIEHLFSDGFDFLKGSHNGYAVDNPSCGSCPIMSTNPVVITRNIFYPKLGENLDYFIVSDKMLGSGTHTYDQYWHLASPIGSVSFDSNKVSISPNLIIAPADPSELIQSIDNTHWLSYTYATRVNAPIINYKKSNIVGSENYDTVIFPFKTDQPSILVNRLPITSGGNPVNSVTASALDIYLDRIQDFRDYYYISHDANVLRLFGAYETDSQLSYIRKDNSGSIKRIIRKYGSTLKEGTSDLAISAGDNVVIDSNVGTSSIVKITADTLYSFRIYAPTATSVTLNGNPHSFIQNGDYIEFTGTPICIDIDLDGYGNPGSLSCSNGPETDCNDNNINVHPGAVEVCDGIDNNCINGIDEGGNNLCTNNIFCDGIETCNGILGCSPGTTVNCNDVISCTIDSCNEVLDRCDNIPNNNLCSNGLYCDGTEICNPLSGCQSGAPIDCSTNNIPPINTCFNSPDNIPFTLDTRAGFTSICIEATDTCSVGSSPLTHTCSFTQCSAQCDLTHLCQPTECDLFDGCYNNLYRNYNDISNTCLSGCSCTTNSCTNYVQESDPDNDGYTLSCGDCQPNNGNINPGVRETTTVLCSDNIDNDCDSNIDFNDPDCISGCIDNDGDNYGIGQTCIGPDCNDNNQNIHATISCNYNGISCGNYQLCLLSCPTPPSEICGNGIDDNCNGPIDEGCPIQLIYNLQQGYNFITVPFELTDNNINQVFAGILNDLSRIYAFEVNWKVYRTTPIPPSTLSIISPLKGYIVIMNNPNTISLAGNINSNNQVNLQTGWNLIGTNSLSLINVNTALQGLDYTTVWSYDINQQTYIQLNPLIDNFEPGKAYWVYLNNPGIFNP